jgi:hypothetical protein
MAPRKQSAHRMRAVLPLRLGPEQCEGIVRAVVLENNGKGAVGVAALQILLVCTKVRPSCS